MAYIGMAYIVIHMSIHMSVHLSMYMSMYIPIHLPMLPSTHLSMCMLTQPRSAKIVLA